MTEVDRVKRQMLRELVRENVDLKHNRLPRRKHARKSLWQRLPLAARIAAVALPAAVLLGSFWMLWVFRPEALPPVVAATVKTIETAVPVQAAAPRISEASDPRPGPAVDASVFPLAVRRVVIDPGHGGDNEGAHAPLGLIEKDLTIDISDRLRKLLAERGFEVLVTRRGDQAVSLQDRAALANQSDADIFVSIHLNWIEDQATRGVETYYLGPTNDPYLTRLAAAENRDSGHSLADVRRLLDRIYAGVRQDNSRKLAESIQASLFQSLGKLNPSLKDRGVKAAPFIVLLDTEMPAILAEVSCLSNEEEARLLTQPHYRQYIAEALAAGIRSYADAAQGLSGAPAEKGT
ncbi:MAG TPA: N-acetylmuramoyl-L-alanine amidase [Thermoanaerobaculia bacterium]|nr:N-acetylmuramoyl-L-alanine amidase [Thermoanaerobaculia bacterium]